MQQGIRQTKGTWQCTQSEILRLEGSQPGGALKQGPEEEVRRHSVEQDQDEVIGGRGRDREESLSVERGRCTIR